jgi:NADH dehydrogenase, FAD-containing subunit
MTETADILILGGGFSGLWGAANAVDVARENNATLAVTLVSPSEHLIMRPRLYEANPSALRRPLQPLLGPLGIDFVQGTATSISTAEKLVQVQTKVGIRPIRYRKLVLATGSNLSKLPITGAAELSWNVDSYPAAKAFDDHLAALAEAGPDEAANTFVIVGAGMVGIELATELRDRIAEHAGHETAERARIELVERGAAVGPLFGDEPRPVIEAAMAAARVNVRLDTEVTQITAESAILRGGEVIPTRSVILAAGMVANDLTMQVPGKRDALGRLYVDETLRVLDVPDVFASGDVANAKVDGSHTALMACQNSQTMGKYVGRNVAADLLGLAYTPYSQADYTTCLDLGRFGALYTEGFERKLVAYGDQVGPREETAKQRKRRINEREIYPPDPGPAEAMLSRFRIDSRGR